jgi:hypothetical protein
MSEILEQVGRPSGGFRPRSESEYLALQLARRLGDPQNVEFYVSLVEHHPREQILQSYRTVLKRHPAASEIAERFRLELERRSRRSNPWT